MDEQGCVMGVGDNGKALTLVEEVEAFSAEPGIEIWSLLSSLSLLKDILFLPSSSFKDSALRLPGS